MFAVQIPRFSGPQMYAAASIFALTPGGQKTSCGGKIATFRSRRSQARQTLRAAHRAAAARRCGRGLLGGLGDRAMLVAERRRRRLARGPGAGAGWFGRRHVSGPDTKKVVKPTVE